MTFIIKYFVTWFGSGLSPKAPGTAGSLAALPFVWLAHELHLMWALGLLALLFLVVGAWASNRYMAATGKVGDPKEIVIDEVVGQWLVFAAMPLMWLPISYEWQLEILAAGFVAFRFFDILKPWPISMIDERMKGGWGVMLDDVAAGVAALVTLGILGHTWPMIIH